MFSISAGQPGTAGTVEKQTNLGQKPELPTLPKVQHGITPHPAVQAQKTNVWCWISKIELPSEDWNVGPMFNMLRDGLCCERVFTMSMCVSVYVCVSVCGIIFLSQWNGPSRIRICTDRHKDFAIFGRDDLQLVSGSGFHGKHAKRCWSNGKVW